MFVQYYDWDGTLCRLTKDDTGRPVAEVWLEGEGYRRMAASLLLDKADPISRQDASLWLARREQA